MTFYDRTLVRIIQFFMLLLYRRCDQGKGRVFWFRTATNRPGPRNRFTGELQPKHGLFEFGFGGSEHEAIGNIAQIGLTREMLDLLADGTRKVIDDQDAQYAILEEG